MDQARARRAEGVEGRGVMRVRVQRWDVDEGADWNEDDEPEDGEEPDALLDFVRLMPPPPRPLHNVDLGGTHCSGCLTTPSPWCAACGAPATEATVAGGSGEQAPRCSVSWCEHCLFELLVVRMESLCRNYSIKSFEPLEFLPFEPSATLPDWEGVPMVAEFPERRAHGSTAMLSSEARANTTTRHREPKSTPAKKTQPKTRRRPAPLSHPATTPNETREPRRQSQSDSSPVGKSTAAQRRVTSPVAKQSNTFCRGERNISGQRSTRGKRSQGNETPRRARKKGA